MAAVGAEIVTRIVGYEQQPGNAAASTPNLPIRVGVPVEVNEAQQAGLVTDPVQITSIAQAAALCGYGSPGYQIAKILFPRSGDGIGGIPVFFYPQVKAGGATAKVIEVTATGNATANGTHYIVICGRKTVDGQTYAINIVAGDTPTIIHTKIQDAVNAVLGAPVTGVGIVAKCTLTSKWMGLTANDITVSMDTNGNSLGVTYAVNAAVAAGAGTPDITPALAMFGSNWVTHVINTYGTVVTTMDALEAHNGKPATATNIATGRWIGTIYKPYVAYTGSVSADPSAITDSRKTNCTIKLSPAPNSKGLPMEAAANDCLLSAICAQNTPHLDTIGMSYPDMPTPEVIGVMSDWKERQRIVLKGCSTVDIIAGQYVIQDPVTTFHPDGDIAPQQRFARIIFIDWNVRYAFLIKEQQYVVDHVIAKDDEKVTATKVVKPKTFTAVLADMADDLSQRALITDIPYMVNSIDVNLSNTNPDRLSTFFKYKRTGVVRISDTTAEAAFNYGSLTAN